MRFLLPFIVCTPLALGLTLAPRSEDGFLVPFTTGGGHMEYGSFIGGGTGRTAWNAGTKSLATDEDGTLYVAAIVNGA